MTNIDDKFKKYVSRRCKAHNELKMWLNNKIPLVQEQLAKGFNVKSDCSLFKKDADAINNILMAGTERGGRRPFRYWLECMKYSIILNADCTTPGRYGEGTDYIKEHSYLYEYPGDYTRGRLYECKPREIISAAAFIRDIKKIDACTEKSEQLAAQASKLKYRLNWEV